MCHKRQDTGTEKRRRVSAVSLGFMCTRGELLGKIRIIGNCVMSEMVTNLIPLT